MTTEIEKGDFVHLTFDKENGLDNEHKGEVLEVDDDDPDGYGVELFAKITDGDSNTEIHYYEGEADGEEFATVTRHSPFSGDCRIGTNADVEVFG